MSETQAQLSFPHIGHRFCRRKKHLFFLLLALSACGSRAGVVITSLYSFTGNEDGAFPNRLTQGSDGHLYGTTYGGGDGLGNAGSGTVFEMSTNGALASLHTFSAGVDGGAPNAGLVQGSDGNFYGTTSLGGTNGDGAVFKITPGGALTSLYSFTGGNDGFDPVAELVQGSGGNFYGTTYDGGSNGVGTIFSISPNGALTTSYSLQGRSDGANPNSALTRDSAGNFYGTAYNGGTNRSGTVFELGASGAFTTLYSFKGGNDGARPNRVALGADGNLYGTTDSGGITNQTGFGQGTIFKIGTNGVLTTLYSFTGSNDGANPEAGLTQGADGYFYGTTYYGGTYGAGQAGNGTLFRISTNGAFTSLYSFLGRIDGGNPLEMLQGSDGSFYGVTEADGAGGVGTIFQLAIVRAPPVFQSATPANSALSLTWSTEAGELYQLQFKSGLNSDVWSNLGGPLTATGSTLTATASVTNGPQRLYRVVLLP